MNVNAFPAFNYSTLSFDVFIQWGTCKRKKTKQGKKPEFMHYFFNIVEESNGSLMQFLLDWLQLLTLPQKRHRSTHELMPNTDR